MHWSCILHLGSGYFQGNLKFWQRYTELEKHPVLPWLSPSHPTESRLQLPGKGHSAPPSHTTIGGREGNTMLQLWNPNTALNSFHKFSNPSWLLTHGAFLKHRAHPAASGSGSPWPALCRVWGGITLCLPCSCAYLPTADSRALLQSLQRAPYSGCCCPATLVTLCTSMYIPKQTLPTTLFVFLQRENVNKMHFLAFLKGSTWTTAALTDSQQLWAPAQNQTHMGFLPDQQMSHMGSGPSCLMLREMDWREFLHWCTCLSTEEGQRDIPCPCHASSAGRKVELPCQQHLEGLSSDDLLFTLSAHRKASSLKN